MAKVFKEIAQILRGWIACFRLAQTEGIFERKYGGAGGSGSNPASYPTDAYRPPADRSRVFLPAAMSLRKRTGPGFAMTVEPPSRSAQMPACSRVARDAAILSSGKADQVGKNRPPSTSHPADFNCAATPGTVLNATLASGFNCYPKLS